MCKKLALFLNKRLKVTKAGITLNYLTLSISDKQVAEDLENHKMEQVDSLFWVC